ncbi:DUF4395 domain-containing protein [Ruania halotolerans]|uniref:DUF4395 domain-containing protein n=1 Tax=Ruania halotolerans TaxID=2897773 RepID=UPI001E51F8CC|nr:DUF4395 domain-containing protein [Ruania halotolerans]UFU08230.1 DUF4395 domain-containing protein [Ruania halotolerans]
MGPAPSPSGIDPRGPRVGAALTSALLVLAIVVGGSGGLMVLAVVVASFLLGTVGGVGRTWQGLLYRVLIRPRLVAPQELEDPRPPRFAQGIGLAITGVGLILGLLGVTWALPVFAGIALIAAFLNAAFGLCLGCEMYLLLLRVRSPRTA